MLHERKCHAYNHNDKQQNKPRGMSRGWWTEVTIGFNPGLFYGLINHLYDTKKLVTSLFCIPFWNVRRLFNHVLFLALSQKGRVQNKIKGQHRSCFLLGNIKLHCYYRP